MSNTELVSPGSRHSVVFWFHPHSALRPIKAPWIKPVDMQYSLLASRGNHHLNAALHKSGKYQVESPHRVTLLGSMSKMSKICIEN